MRDDRRDRDRAGRGSGDLVGFQLSPDGRELRWAFELGSEEDGLPPGLGRAVAATPEGGLLVAGSTRATEFPTVEAFQPDSGGAQDGLLVRVEPGPAPATLYEPSARDARNWVDPLTIAQVGDLLALDLGWEESMGEPSYGLVVGDLGRLRTARRVETAPVACDLTEPSYELETLEGDVHFLVVAVVKDDEGGSVESSYGRDSFGVERPPSTPRCID